MASDIIAAKKFIRGIDLAGRRRSTRRRDAHAEPEDVFDAAKAQANVVGSGVFSFARGVTPEVREAISDSALLAQLVANKNTARDTDPIKWFTQYSNVLEQLGWVVQEGAWTNYSKKGTAAEVHEKVLEILTVTLGPGAAALAIITASVNALKAMKPDSPWLTIFNRESQHAKIARFQIGLVDREADGQVFVQLLICLVEGRDTITQVLVFKFRQARASFKANSLKVSINRNALVELGPLIRSKTRAYQVDYVSNVLNVGP